MSNIIKEDEFVEIALQNDCDPLKIKDFIVKNVNPGYTATSSKIRNRIGNLRRKGLLPLGSGNTVDQGQLLTGTSTQYDSNGEIKQQWVKTNTAAADQLIALREALDGIVQDLPPLKPIKQKTNKTYKDLATVYISNDVHFGLLTWHEETGYDWNTEKAVAQMKEAYDYLFDTSPDSKVGIVVDLGDMTEADDFKNATPTSGNPVDTDSRYPKVLRASYQSLMYAISKALEKHEIVYFYNIPGNHDIVTAHAVREVIMQAFQDNPRVIVDESPSPIKYHQHKTVLLGFAHGDGLKMNKAGETMAIDCKEIFSETDHRFFHFGHTHVDSVRDTAICKAESHRNIPPVNAWAHHKGYRRGVGTMKSITYHKDDGEISRNLFNMKTK